MPPLQLLAVVQPDGHHQHRAPHHRLHVGGQAQHVHAVAQQGNQHHADHGADHAALAPLQGGAPHHHAQDGVGLVPGAAGGVGRGHPGHQGDGAQGRHQPRQGIHQAHGALDVEPAQPRRVLVAEDEGLIRLDIVETLTGAGFEVVGEASNGEEAVQLALELEPDLCVMDVKMPKMDGITAAEKILAELSCAVVMLTAFSQTELVERARDAGAMAYVVKPFSPADLIPAVEIALSRHQEIESLEEEVADLTDRFETRKRVDRAKGLLMKNMGMSEPDAFRWIQKTSMDRRLSMREVADAVINQVEG